MSIRHDVTIHCDLCMHWTHGNRNGTAALRKQGWLSWRNESGRARHVCPHCTQAGKTRQDVTS